MADACGGRVGAKCRGLTMRLALATALALPALYPPPAWAGDGTVKIMASGLQRKRLNETGRSVRYFALARPEDALRIQVEGPIWLLFRVREVVGRATGGRSRFGIKLTRGEYESSAMFQAGPDMDMAGVNVTEPGLVQLRVPPGGFVVEIHKQKTDSVVLLTVRKSVQGLKEYDTLEEKALDRPRLTAPPMPIAPMPGGMMTPSLSGPAPRGPAPTVRFLPNVLAPARRPAYLDTPECFEEGL